MILYRDFIPKTVKGNWIRSDSYETFDEAVDAANAWLESESVTLMSLETVVLPNISLEEEGTSDAQLETVSGWATWHQFLRVWYRQK